jgi:hypothetical protein
MSLPAYPWNQRPDDLPLTAEEVCAALYEAEGDVTAASIRLKVGSLTLRKFVERSSRARAVIREMDNRLADKAKRKLGEALDDPDNRRVDWAIRYVLNSNNARHLGYSSTDNAGDPQRAAINGPLVTLNLPPVEWQDGTKIGPRELAKNVIELHPAALPKASRNSGEEPE